jgi:cytoskeletal protein CcmA (bactofilin family)
MKDNGKEKRGSIESVLNTITRGTVLEGKITTDGDIRVEGVVKGSIHCKAKLSIGEHGMVDGNIDARIAIISGNVKGTVIVRELLQLQETGKIHGDIITQKLSVQVGALFTGNCRMGQEARNVMDRKTEEHLENGVKENMLKENAGANAEASKSTAANIPRL